MSRILLVDDSPHAQRMGERILTDEGYEVVTVSNADSALIRLDDVDPDVVLADTVMPGRTGFEICQFLKMSPRHRHVRVILTAGALEPLDEGRVRQVEADGALKKPFEASALLGAVKPLAEAAEAARVEGGKGGGAGRTGTAPAPAAAVPFVTVVDAEQVRAAVTVALDAAMDGLVDEITGRVLAGLMARKPEDAAPVAAPAPPLAPAPTVPPLAPAAAAPLDPQAGELPPKLAVRPAPEPPMPAPPPEAAPRGEVVRRVSPLRLRTTGSILGLDIGRPEPPEPDSSGAPPT